MNVPCMLCKRLLYTYLLYDIYITYNYIIKARGKEAPSVQGHPPPAPRTSWPSPPSARAPGSASPRPGLEHRAPPPAELPMIIFIHIITKNIDSYQ